MRTRIGVGFDSHKVTLRVTGQVTGPRCSCPRCRTAGASSPRSQVGSPSANSPSMFIPGPTQAAGPRLGRRARGACRRGRGWCRNGNHNGISRRACSTDRRVEASSRRAFKSCIYFKRAKGFLDIIILHNLSEGKMNALFNNLTILLPPVKKSITFLCCSWNSGDWPVSLYQHASLEDLLKFIDQTSNMINPAKTAPESPSIFSPIALVLLLG